MIVNAYPLLKVVSIKIYLLIIKKLIYYDRIEKLRMKLIILKKDYK